MDIPPHCLTRYAGSAWLAATLHEWEMSSLFGGAAVVDDDAPFITVAVAKKRELSTPDVQLSGAAEAAAEAARVTKQLRMSNGGGVSSTTNNNEAAEVVREWFTAFDAEGKAGNIGLVPEPLRQQYPNRAPNELDPRVRAHVEHFYMWTTRNNTQ